MITRSISIGTFISIVFLVLSGALFKISVLFSTTTYLFILYLIVPGIMIPKKPWLSYAWIGWLTPILFPPIPWEGLSTLKKTLVYTQSIGSFLAGILFLILLIWSKVSN